MRVLINSWRDLAHPQAGGSEVVIDDLARSLVGRGHEVTVRCGGPLADHDDYRVVAGGGTYTQYLRTPFDLWRHAGESDIVVDVNNGMGYYSPWCTTRPTIGLVHHVHTEQWRMFFGPVVSALGRAQERHLMPRAYRNGLVIGTSPSTVQSLTELGVQADRIRMLPIQCSIAEVAPTPQREPLFVACGRLTAHKRHDLLLKLWERVRPMVGGRLVIIGDGPEHARLESLAGPGVELVGAVDETTKASLMTDATLLLHTAPWEGWGLVITEAGLVGCPAIGFDVVGVRDAIRNGQTGIVAANEDAFVDAWVGLARDERRRHELGRGAKRYAEALTAVDRGETFESILAESIELDTRRRGSTETSLPPGRPPVSVVDIRVHTDHGGNSDGRASRSRNLSVIVPAYNEAARIGALLHRLPDYLDDASTEVIVVDDGSTDATVAVAEAAMAPMTHARVLRLDENRGKGAALRAGVAASRGRQIVFMDADGATDLACLAPMLAALDDTPIAIGSRSVETAVVANGQRHRRYMAGAFKGLVHAASPLRISDSQCGFKAFRGPVARLLFHLSSIDGFAQDVELLVLASQMGFEITEVPVTWTAIDGSKVSVVKDSIAMARDVAAMRVRVPTGPIVSGLTVRAGDRSSSVVAKEVASCLRVTDPVIDDGDDVHVVLPAVAREHLPLLAARVEAAVGTGELRTWTIDARSLRRLAQGPMQSAWASIGSIRV